jgi:hypothetical protein
MTDYILVPVDLLSELAESLACELDARYPASVRSYESQDRKYQAEMEPVLTARQIITAAPAVQGEAAAWQLRTQDERLLQSAANSLRGYALELMLSHTLENGEWPDGEETAKEHHDHMMALAKGLEELKAARTEAVQGEPVGEVRLELGSPSYIFAELYSETLPSLAPGTKLYTAPQPAKQQPAPDVAGLVEALERSVAGFDALSGMASLDAGARNYARQKALELNAVIAARRKQGG